MEVTLPVIPSGLTVLLAFLAPYAVAVINHPAWAPKYKRLVSIVVTILLAAVSMLFYFMQTGYVFPDPVQFILLFLMISQAAYALLLKPSAKAVEASVGTRDKADDFANAEG
jgi:glucan phosphoethanolaminetransferase (alkaline phosphatase superfamily)